MDANGTRYHLLLGEEDWTRRTLADPLGSAAFDKANGDLTLTKLEFFFDHRQGDVPPRLADRRGTAADGYGNLYWIDADETSILVQSTGSGATTLFWTPGLHASPEPDRTFGAFGPAPETEPQPPPARPIPLRGLAVTEDHYLVAGTVEPGGILVFDLTAGGPPSQELWPDPEQVPFSPFDLCARAGGGVFVLDRDNRRLWELDRHFVVVTRAPAGAASPPEFGPVDPAVAPSGDAPAANRPIGADDGIFLGGDPIAIEPAPGGRVLVLDQNAAAPPSTVRLLDPGEPTGPAAPIARDVPGDGEATVEIVAYDMALVPGSGNGALGTLYVVDAGGNQSFAFALSLDANGLHADLSYDYFPMRVFGGKGLVEAQGGPMYDFGDGWVPLVRQSKPRFETASTLYGPSFDGKLPGTVWHRLLLDACIPPDTSVTIESRAADDERELSGAAWQPEPPLVYRRGDGSELPFAPAEPSPAYGTWEVLFQRAQGRLLQLRIVLAGDGRASPRLHALRAYYPRFSYLDRYLPKVYGDDPESASFLDRYLANAEGIQTSIEDRVAAVQALFDPRTAPAEELEWLLGWFDFAADPTWQEDRIRLFLRHAMDFFALRGTMPGIVLALRLALDRCEDEDLFASATPGDRTARIVERYRTRRTPAVVLGDPTELSAPHIVPAGPRWDPTQGGEALVARWQEVAGEGVDFPLADTSALWEAFVRDVLGFEPPGAFDPSLWTDFLTTRYGRIDTLNAAYGLVGAHAFASFPDVAFPEQLPPDGAPLRDWYHFLALVLPARRSAHRFTVLLPIPPANDNGWTPEERRAIAQRVVELQKPAHTTFDVKFFWAAFRLGEARLGDDTLLDLGSRDPRLRQPLVLGREHAGESYLGGDPAPTVGHQTRRPLNR